MSFEEKIVKNSIFGDNLRFFLKDKVNSWFVGNEIAKGLEFKNPRNAIASNIRERNKTRLENLLVDLPREKRDEIFSNLHPKTIMINDLAVYNICLKSTSEKAEPFQDWVYEMIRSVTREGVEIPGLEGLSLKDNPERVIERTKKEIPTYKEDKIKRKKMHKEYRDGDNKTKDPFQQAAGHLGGTQTWANVRKMEKALSDVYNIAGSIVKK